MLFISVLSIYKLIDISYSDNNTNQIPIKNIKENDKTIIAFEGNYYDTKILKIIEARFYFFDKLAELNHLAISELVNSYFDTYEKDVDHFLDWYYTLNKIKPIWKL
jgi:hypothetical protein